MRQRFQRGEVSGISDEMLAELAAITWLVDPRGRIAIEGKADVKAALGHSPDLAEALMLALGEAPPQPFEYTPAGVGAGRFNNPWPMIPSYYDRDSSQAKGEAVAAYEDSGGGACRWALVAGPLRWLTRRGTW